MFTKTVDSVIANFKKAVSDLDKIAVQQEAAQEELHTTIDSLHEKLRDSEAQQKRARTISANLKKLLEE